LFDYFICNAQIKMVNCLHIANKRGE